MSEPGSSAEIKDQGPLSDLRTLLRDLRRNNPEKNAHFAEAVWSICTGRTDIPLPLPSTPDQMQLLLEAVKFPQIRELMMKANALNKETEKNELRSLLEPSILCHKSEERMEDTFIFNRVTCRISTDFGGEKVRDLKGMTENQDAVGAVPFGKSLVLFVVDEASQSGGNGKAAQLVTDAFTSTLEEAQGKSVNLVTLLSEMYQNAETRFDVDSAGQAKGRDTDGSPEDGYACAGICLIDTERKRIFIDNKGDTRQLVIVDGPGQDVRFAVRSLLQNAGAEERVSSGGNPWVADFDYMKESRKNEVSAVIGVNKLPGEELKLNPHDHQMYIPQQEGEKITVVGGSDGWLGDRISDDEVLYLYKQVGGDPIALHTAIDALSLERNGKNILEIGIDPDIKLKPIFMNQRQCDNYSGFVAQVQF